jgi:hypothetical protein
VPAILLDQVAEQPAQTGMAPVGPGQVDELVESTVGKAAPSLALDHPTVPSQSA